MTNGERGDERGAGSRRRPVVLCILDGWGWREAREDNAVALARTPNFDRWHGSAPRCLLRTDGEHVGLPEGQMGNSEVGHMNLGAGRVVMQELPRLDQAFADGSLVKTDSFAALVEKARAGSGRIHIMGLVSPGGVHSHQRHLVAVAQALADQGLDLVVHAFLDGRDTPPRSARGYVETLEKDLAGIGRPCPIVTVSGRYYAMDRDRRWDRTQMAYDALVDAKAPGFARAADAIEAAYAEDVTDEFVEPAVIGDYAGISDGDAVVCINFRADRVRQLMRALAEPGFAEFEPERRPELAAIAGMTSYSAALDKQLLVLSPPHRLDKLMGEVVAGAGLTQLRMAETEKYPHVTFFFNGGEENRYPGEERVLVPSPKVRTYDLQPEMSAEPLTDKLVEAVEADHFDFILINYANPDMVGHTGSLEAAIKAVETVDTCLGRLVDAVLAAGGAALVTADHGNCEVMRDPETGAPHTAHTTNPVPCFLVGGPSGDGDDVGLGPAGAIPARLADVAPTLLALLGLPQPQEMTGESLLRR